MLHSTVAGRIGGVVSLDVVPMTRTVGAGGFIIAVMKLSGIAITALYESDKLTASEAWRIFDAIRNPVLSDVAQLRVDQDSI